MTLNISPSKRRYQAPVVVKDSPRARIFIETLPELVPVNAEVPEDGASIVQLVSRRDEQGR